MRLIKENKRSARAMMRTIAHHWFTSASYSPLRPAVALWFSDGEHPKTNAIMHSHTVELTPAEALQLRDNLNRFIAKFAEKGLLP